MAYLRCLTWGELQPGELGHPDCVVVVRSPLERGLAVPWNPVIETPAVCGCECKGCKRAWWAKGRPRVVAGMVYSERPQS